MFYSGFLLMTLSTMDTKSYHSKIIFYSRINIIMAVLLKFLFVLFQYLHIAFVFIVETYFSVYISGIKLYLFIAVIY